jgi:HD-like signal output (HDOD) protein
MTRINPHEAMFAGLVHDIGQFYLLSRASKWPELAADRAELGKLVFEWHTSVGHAVLSALGMAEDIILAVDEHELPMREDRPRTLVHVVSVANEIAEKRNPFVTDEMRAAVRGAVEPMPAMTQEQIVEILRESREEMASILDALRG